LDITQEALAKRKAEVATARESKSVKGGIKADARIAPNAARQENATTIAARTETYGQDAKLVSLIFADANIEKSGYLNALEEATVGDIAPNKNDKNVERARIQVIYDEAYKAGGQAQKSAAEISGALRNALPEGVRPLGNIGDLVPVKVANFEEAKTKLEAFAEAIFNDPSCKGLYSDDTKDENGKTIPGEKTAVKELVIGKALKYAEAGLVSA
jgi:hypothetical protein